MQNAEPKQFKLNDAGEILFQADPTNPLPGRPVARIGKGESLLSPEVKVIDLGADMAKINEWLKQHIHETLLPLMMLKDEEAIQPQARAITDKVYDALGILPRADLEEPIAGLDETGRAALRARKVRLGPILVFLPQLNKPAAVRLRALLWTLWHGKPLPAPVPADGVTTVSLAGKSDADPLFYRSVGYPVYGPRAIRVDMLDRVITAVYDSADKGVFKAKHEMAEWLGCPIPDLYAVLEAMGHTKISDPADAPVAVAAESAPAPESASVPAPEVPAAETPPAEAKPPVKPELATFRLRRGKAYGEAPQRKPRPDKAEHPKKDHRPPKKDGFKKDKFKKDGPPRDKKPKRPERERTDRVISAAPARVADSPFAVLKDLKVQNKD